MRATRSWGPETRGEEHGAAAWPTRAEVCEGSRIEARRIGRKLVSSRQARGQLLAHNKRFPRLLDPPRAHQFFQSFWKRPKSCIARFSKRIASTSGLRSRHATGTFFVGCRVGYVTTLRYTKPGVPPNSTDMASAAGKMSGTAAQNKNPPVNEESEDDVDDEDVRCLPCSVYDLLAFPFSPVSLGLCPFGTGHSTQGVCSRSHRTRRPPSVASGNSFFRKLPMILTTWRSKGIHVHVLFSHPSPSPTSPPRPKKRSLRPPPRPRKPHPRFTEASGNGRGEGTAPNPTPHGTRETGPLFVLFRPLKNWRDLCACFANFLAFRALRLYFFVASMGRKSSPTSLPLTLRPTETLTLTLQTPNNTAGRPRSETRTAARGCGSGRSTRRRKRLGLMTRRRDTSAAPTRAPTSSSNQERCRPRSCYRTRPLEGDGGRRMPVRAAARPARVPRVQRTPPRNRCERSGNPCLPGAGTTSPAWAAGALTGARTWAAPVSGPGWEACPSEGSRVARTSVCSARTAARAGRTATTT